MTDEEKLLTLLILQLIALTVPGAVAFSMSWFQSLQRPQPLKTSLPRRRLGRASAAGRRKKLSAIKRAA